MNQVENTSIGMEAPEAKKCRGRPKKVPSELEKPIEPVVDLQEAAPSPQQKKTAKGRMRDEVLEKEKQARLEQIALEAELKKKALDEVSRMEDYKRLLIRDEIKKQLEDSAQKEVKKTRRKATESVANKEGKAVSKKIIKEVIKPTSMPAPVENVVKPHIIAPEVFVRAPIISPDVSYQNTAFPMLSGISRRFSNRGGF